MTATTLNVHPDLAEASESDETECCVEDCHAPPVARAVCLPCGCNAGYCRAHRADRIRTCDFLWKDGRTIPCGLCRTPILDVMWVRP